MSFKTLENRYNETVNKLYSGATLKFAGGKPSTGKFDDPLIVRQPGNGYWVSSESRLLPLVSTQQDLKRITWFSLSGRGLLFLAKQQLLQTGNTFAITRTINPTFVVGNTTPTLHLRRHLLPTNTLLSKTDTGYGNVKKLGQLQQETYDKFSPSSGGLLQRILDRVTGSIGLNIKQNVGNWNGGKDLNWKKSRPELGLSPDKYFIYQLSKNINSKTMTINLPFIGSVTIPTSSPNNNIFRFGGNIGTSQNYGYLTSDGKSTSYLANKNLSTVAEKIKLENRFKSSKQKINNEKEKKDYQSDVDKFIKTLTGGKLTNQPFLKYFEGSKDSIVSRAGAVDGSLNIRDRTSGKGKVSYLRDPANNSAKKITNQRIMEPYNILPNIDPTNGKSAFDDPITVSFAMGTDNAVQFRAFITDLQQSSNPEYKSYQYIGRIEKFITYTSVQREISFKLSVLAFSKDELNIVWTRLNYLTGLVFPYGVNKGILQPNIVKLTIGNVYVNQPGYITSLNVNFNEPSETWDIDKQVPIGATADIKMLLIEKKTALANSPFYKISDYKSAGSMNYADLLTIDKLQPTISTTSASPPKSTITLPDAVKRALKIGG